MERSPAAANELIVSPRPPEEALAGENSVELARDTIKRELLIWAGGESEKFFYKFLLLKRVRPGLLVVRAPRSGIGQLY